MKIVGGARRKAPPHGYAHGCTAIPARSIGTLDQPRECRNIHCNKFSWFEIMANEGFQRRPGSFRWLGLLAQESFPTPRTRVLRHFSPKITPF